jgi:hypothetical protein
VKLPRLERERPALVPLTSEQVQALADTIAPSRYRALVLVAAGLTRARPGITWWGARCGHAMILA